VRRVQALRKEAGFNVNDRIYAYYQAEGELAEGFHCHSNYLPRMRPSQSSYGPVLRPRVPSPKAMTLRVIR
jgi:hypothetical protein